jgi:Ser/Thr protein kinase RdoA (MazF antagonist)
VSMYCHYTFHVVHNKITLEEAKRQLDLLIAAYRAVRPLSEEEVKALPYLNFTYMLFYLEFHYLHYDDWSNTFFGERHLKGFAKHMKDQITLFQ